MLCMGLSRNHISSQGDQGKVEGLTPYYAAIAF